jgi:hypothetical protein
MSYYSRFNNGVNIAGVNVLNTHGGNVFWVDSGASNSSDGNNGTFKQPLATLDTAIGKCTASNGDLIVIQAGHSETVTTSIAADVVGITIVGLGNGDNRPSFVGPNADACIDVSANNVALVNLRFTADAGTTQAATQKLNITGTYCTVEGCEFTMGQYDDVGAYVAYTADHCTFRNCEFYVSANGPDVAILLEGATGGNALTYPVLENCVFDGMSATNAWDEGTVYCSGVHTNGRIFGNTFLFMSGGVGGIEFVAAATGAMDRNFFAGGTLGQMLDPGSYMCGRDNAEADAVDQYARIFPTTEAS